ncbi:alpha/beta hydrolase [Paenarthrobacter sp. Y-19]|uniref:alpha/beta hydrolase n=1 Tax=unclassified Paenarthrobacter TaxID=2634190 RepID=UPI001E70B090|nr:alpha/beta hydrolase [Paenarthrobacter sp. Y-19]BCW42578.1 hypothetical protein StoSoilB3_41130 [Arthrobacter sp. StoSoilB3]
MADSPERRITRTPLLFWASVVCAAVLVLVPAWMLAGNPAVLRGHPLLPSLLVTAAVVGLLWGLLLWRRRRAQRPRSVVRTVGSWLGRVAVLALVAMLFWLNPFAYQPPADQASGPASSFSITEDPTSIVLTPEASEVSTGLVFYPGARVEARAYVDLLKPAADAGFLVVILKEPLNLSLLNGDQARSAMAAHPAITTWAVGGHSLGGVSASSFALGNADVDGLLLYASYPLESLRERAGLMVESISGTEDGLSTPAKIEASRDLLPGDTRFVAVQGGNHAFFGNYGAQPGDGQPGVDRSVAQAQIAAATVEFLQQLKTP